MKGNEKIAQIRKPCSSKCYEVELICSGAKVIRVFHNNNQFRMHTLYVIIYQLNEFTL